MSKKRPPKEVRDHWSRVAALGCLITQRPNPTLHHCKGGTMKYYVQKSLNQKPSHWLVIPLDWEYHNGRYGIDNGYGVESWERDFGPQVEHLDKVCQLLGINVWKRAGIDRQVMGVDA